MKSFLTLVACVLLFSIKAQYFSITQPSYVKLNLDDKELSEFISFLKEQEGEEIMEKIKASAIPVNWPSCIKEQTPNTTSNTLKKGIVVGEWYHNHKYVLFEVNPSFDETMANNCNNADFKLFFIADRRIGSVKTKDDEGNVIEVFDTIEQAYINQIVFNEKTNINGKIAGKLNLREFLDAENYPQTYIDLIKKFGVETNWPAGLKTAELRSKNKDEIAKYKAYPTMGTLFYEGEIYGIAWIPFSKNQHMREDLRPTSKEGFFLILNIDYSSKDDLNDVIIIPKSHIK